MGSCRLQGGGDAPVASLSRLFAGDCNSGAIDLEHFASRLFVDRVDSRELFFGGETLAALREQTSNLLHVSVGQPCGLPSW